MTDGLLLFFFRHFFGDLFLKGVQFPLLPRFRTADPGYPAPSPDI